ncbi:hypothetical protein BKA07_003171 [Brevibacterium marinum]|uniref:Uncharacterized protein n=1 Tax=Brevibacterium marinum TaxID=418643 RepID=A0A846S1U9_9MICO|nr:hypothetical protein [Brevibacterium marinum]
MFIFPQYSAWGPATTAIPSEQTDAADVKERL